MWVNGEYSWGQADAIGCKLKSFMDGCLAHSMTSDHKPKVSTKYRANGRQSKAALHGGNTSWKLAGVEDPITYQGALDRGPADKLDSCGS
jgi:hypothetical protein